MPSSEASSPSSTPVLEVRSVSKYFGAIAALREVSLHVDQGEIVGLVGDNGAGKSTLIKIVSGVHQPSAGELLIDGRPVEFSSPAEARECGIETVHQDLALVDSFDLAANFFLGREVTRSGLLGRLGVLDKREMSTRARTAVGQMDARIPNLEASLATMSGGQRQIVAIARAAFWKGRLILLDEPTAALGVEESADVLRLMRQMVAKRELGMVVISHNMEEVWQVCDRIVVLRQGRHMATVSRSETSPAEIVRYITGAHLAQRTDEMVDDDTAGGR